MAESRSRIAVIGLGHMGGAIAANLVRVGHEVTGFDKQEEAARHAERAGVGVAASVPDAIADAQFVLTSLPNDAVVRAVWLGEDGLIAHAGDRAVLVETSTISKSAMLEVASAARAAGARVVDCAVSGSPGSAREGGLSLVVGAAPEDLETARPLLSEMGSSLAHVGDVGMGKVVKLVNNLMAMGNMLIAAEAFQIGVAAGVDPQRLYDVLSVSGGRSHHFVSRFPQALAENFSPGFAIRLGEKDLGLGVDLAGQVGVPAPAASTIHALYRVAMSEGFADDDIVGLLQLYRHWTAEHR